MGCDRHPWWWNGIGLGVGGHGLILVRGMLVWCEWAFDLVGAAVRWGWGVEN